MAIYDARAFVLVFGPPWEYAHFDGLIPRDGSLAWLGVFRFAVSIALQVASMLALRDLYTVRLSIQPGHRLITAGPNHWVRHPDYLSNLLALLGISLALSTLSGLAMLALTVVPLPPRIALEERMQLEAFGED